MVHAIRSTMLRAALAIALFESCAGPRSIGPDPGPFVLPAGEGGHYLFREGGADLRGVGAEPKSFAFESSTGPPRALAVDYASGWFAVAYERGLAIVQRSQTGAPRWKPGPWSGAPAAMSISGERVAVVAEREVVIFGLPDGNLIYRVPTTSWLERKGLDVLHRAVPDPRQEKGIFLLGFEEMDFASGARLIIQRVSWDRGDWDESAVTLQLPMTHLHASTTDGRYLYLAGIEERPEPGLQPRLLQKLVVSRIDLESGTSISLLAIERGEERTEVTRLSVNDRLLALTLNEERILVYRLSEGGVDARDPWQKTYRAGVSAVCVEGESFVVLGNGEPTSLSL